LAKCHITNTHIDNSYTVYTFHTKHSLFAILTSNDIQQTFNNNTIQIYINGEFH